MKIKRTSSWIALLAAACLLALPRPSEAAPEAGTALGSAAYSAFGLLRSVEFEVYEADPAHETPGGELYYADSDANWYAVDVVAVSIGRHKAIFAGEVIDSSRPSWRGLWVSVSVIDDDKDGDRIALKLVDKTRALNSVAEEHTLGELFRVIEGDVAID